MLLYKMNARNARRKKLQLQNPPESHYCPVVAVIPAKAGIQSIGIDERNLWIPAFAGMTDLLEIKSKNAFTVDNDRNNGTVVP